MVLGKKRAVIPECALAWVGESLSRPTVLVAPLLCHGAPQASVIHTGA
jgi:hypothetical protein